MPLPVQVDWTTQLQPHFQLPITSVKARTLGSLWAGYGTVTSLQVQLKGQAAPTALIVKDVRPPRGSGVGHDRKIASYRVEHHFYKEIAPDLINATGLGIPRPLALESSPTGFQFILTDLREDYPRAPGGDLDGQQVRHVLAGVLRAVCCVLEAPRKTGNSCNGWFCEPPAAVWLSKSPRSMVGARAPRGVWPLLQLRRAALRSSSLPRR
jgi:hypothetical protein